MRTRVLALFLTLGASAFAAGTPCASLAALTIPKMTIKSATPLKAGPFSIANARTIDFLPEFCRIVAIATPSPDSIVNFEVWIPSLDAWNGKFEGVGNTAFLGAIDYVALADGLRRGYAVAGSDTGHTGSDIAFGIGHPDKLVDWAYRATHAMTEAARLIVRDGSGRFPQHSYFNGCNTGGHQAVMEVQRYPDDYDGVIAGTPAADRVHEIIGYLWAWIASHKDGKSLLAPEKLLLVTEATITACDELDGVKDGVIEDPRRCHFDPATLACSGARTGACLTQSEMSALKKIYDGPHNPRTGELIFHGWAPGSESFGAAGNQSWSNFINLPAPRRVDFLRYFVFDHPDWDWKTFDWDRDVAFADARVGFIDATSRDLDAFQSTGGKLLMYTGWDDPILPPLDIIDYYEAVSKAMGGPAKTSDFFRLFMVPGMGHCGGGPGTINFDMLPALEQWVEKKTPPERITAARISNGKTERTRPLCAYPSIATYTGKGSTDDASNFICAKGASAQ